MVRSTDRGYLELKPNLDFGGRTSFVAKRPRSLPIMGTERVRGGYEAHHMQSVAVKKRPEKGETKFSGTYAGMSTGNVF